MLKNKKTYYQLILDKSGSMKNCVPDTVNGFNEQMQMICSMQKKFPEQEFVVSLTTFNQHVDFDVDQEDPQNIKELISVHQTPDWIKIKDQIVYRAHGRTALYDAIGLSVDRIQEKAGEEINNDEATVVVVIITDGHENASTRYSGKNIQAMIKELEQSENWTFSYLSNTSDAVEYAMRLNIKKENSIRYRKESMHEDYKDITDSMGNYFDKKSRNIKEQTFIKSKRK